MAASGVWPLVGRVEEIERVLGALTDAHGVVLSGASGVGKSRLAAEVLAAAERDGWAAVQLSAGPETAAAPFSPFASLVEEPGDDPVDRFLRVERAITELGERAVLSIDDAHLLDDVSVAFLRHLVTSTSVRVLLTVRSGAPVPSTIVDLWQGGQLERIEVVSLAREETRRLVELALGGTLQERTAAWVWDTTHGNALFVRELVLDAIEQGALVEERGRWSVTAGRQAGSRIQDVVAARVGSLDDDEREAVDLVALAEPMGLAMLEQLVGADVVRRLDGRGLLAGHAERRRVTVRLAHPLHREVVLATMTLTAARDRRRRLIDVMLATGARRGADRQRVALWRCELGDVSDWELLLDAAYEQAAAADRTLVAAWLGGEVTEVEPAPASLERAAVLARGALDGGGSMAAAALLFNVLRRLGRDVEAASVHVEAGMLVAGGADGAWLERMRATDSTFAHALLDEGAMPAAAPPATSRAAAVAMMTGRPGEALHLAREVIADDAADDSDRLLAAAVAAAGLAEAGLVRQGLEQIDLLAPALSSGRAAALAVPASMIRVNLLRVGGRLGEAEELVRSCYVAAERLRDTATMGLFAALGSYLALDRGEVGRAADLATEAVDRLTDVDPFVMRRAALAFRLQACAMLGDEAAIAGAMAALDADELTGAPRPEELRAQAWCDVAAGRMAVAVRRLVASADVHAAAGSAMWEAEVLHDLARLGYVGSAAARLAELAAAGDTPVLDVMADHARAVAGGPADALVAVGDRWEDLGYHLFAAEAFSQACGAYGAAASRAEAASSRARNQRALEATRERSHRALAPCGPVRTPALALAGPRASLTPREHQIAWLAAQGRTNQEIADELVVSIRTVQTHLYNVYAKLGIDNRAALREALRPD